MFLSVLLGFLIGVVIILACLVLTLTVSYVIALMLDWHDRSSDGDTFVI